MYNFVHSILGEIELRLWEFVRYRHVFEKRVGVSSSAHSPPRLQNVQHPIRIWIDHY